MSVECSCALAGWCDRHGMRKNKPWFALCQKSDAYREAWDAGKGPGQSQPPRPVQLGPRYNHWAPLHSYAPKHADNWNVKQGKAWYRAWKLGIPKTGCGCAENWKKETADMPPDFSSAAAFFEWSCKIHDAVNERLGKKFRPTLAESCQIWNFHIEK